MENKWEQTANRAWAVILNEVRKLKASGKTLQEIADIVGVGNRSNISEWLNGNRAAANASFANLMNYLERLGFDYQNFFPQSTPTIHRSSINAPVEKVDGEDLCTINVYASAGAGPGILPSFAEPLFSVSAPPEYFRRSDMAILVEGHSMEPIIPNGAVVGIRKDVPFRANELYLANIPYEGLVIKRIAVDRVTEEFIFKSENPDKEAYPNFPLSIHEAEKIIIGKVVWIMIGY